MHRMWFHSKHLVGVSKTSRIAHRHYPHLATSVLLELPRSWMLDQHEDNILTKIGANADYTRALDSFRCIGEQGGLGFFLGSVAATAAAPRASAEDELELNEDAKKTLMDALAEALTGSSNEGTLQGGDSRDEEGARRGGRQSKEVLNANADQLPNRTPFEMQYEMFKRGMELEDEDNFVGAEQQWTEIIENFNSPNFRATSPGNKFLLARAYSNRGNTRLSLQRTREAILDFSESIDLVPEKGEFWLARGVAYEVRALVPDAVGGLGIIHTLIAYLSLHPRIIRSVVASAGHGGPKSPCARTEYGRGANILRECTSRL